MVLQQIVGDTELERSPLESGDNPQIRETASQRGDKFPPRPAPVAGLRKKEPDRIRQQPATPVLAHIGPAAGDADEHPLLNQTLDHRLHIGETALRFNGELSRPGELGAARPLPALHPVEEEVAKRDILFLHPDQVSPPFHLLSLPG